MARRVRWVVALTIMALEAAACAAIAMLLVPLVLESPSSLPAASVEQLEAGTVMRNVTYCTAEGWPLKMDVYLPRERSAELAPAVVYVHGGGWIEGDKSWVRRIIRADEFTARGYVAVAINYRLAPRHAWPAQIEDVKCGIRHLRANAAEYGVDPDRIGAWGESAGGHLVALLATTDDNAGFGGEGEYREYPEQSSRVQAVVEMFGPTDLTTVAIGSFSSRILAKLILGGEPEVAVLTQASPVTYASPDDPPVLIIHGEVDDLVPASHGQALYERLIAVGAPVDLVTVKNGAHVLHPRGGPIDPGWPELKRKVADFFDHNLGHTWSDGHYFPETGKVARGPFLEYWQTHGSAAQLGYPVSAEVAERSLSDGRTYTTQYFERAVLELHAANEPPNNVLLARLGALRFGEKYPKGTPAQTPNTGPGSVLFPETGKRLGGRFLEHWRANGGVSLFGYPISEEFMETSEVDGKAYIVQYFERAVFEHHPTNQLPNDVLLSQLGTFRYKAIHDEER